jgi:hypothetical protein
LKKNTIRICLLEYYLPSIQYPVSRDQYQDFSIQNPVSSIEYPESSISLRRQRKDLYEEIRQLKASK